MRDIVTAWQHWRLGADGYREVDDERVLALTPPSGRGKTSGAHTHTRGANLFHIREGKVTTVVVYWDRDRALADLGLEE
jgi:ketosteroid isomerase-like protein